MILPQFKTTGALQPSRRKFLTSLSALAVSHWLNGCASQNRSLNIASGIWQGYEFLFVAQRQQWLQQHALKIQEFPSNAGSIRALTAGVVDGAALTLDEVLRLQHAGLPLTIVLVFNVSNGADVLLATPPINNIQQLAGKRIGFSKGTNADLLLALALQQADLSINDVTLVNVAFGEHYDSWQKHQIDALVTYNPVKDKLLAQGANNIFSSAQVPNKIIDVLAIRTEVAANPNYHAQIKTLVDLHFRAQQTWQQRPSTVSIMMAKHLGVSTDKLSASYEGLILPDIAENQRFLTAKDSILLSGAEQLLEPMSQFGLIKQSNLATMQFTDRFLPHTE